jgi:hypothetical protein
MAAEGPKRVRSPELEWYERNQDWLEKEHAGKWIAIKEDKLIAVGDSLDAVMDEAQWKDIARPFVTGVKRKELQGIPMIRKCH